jgi:DNA-directed RNA polymerase alpha subunit
MQNKEKLLTIKELKTLLSVYQDEQKVDFGDKYLVELNCNEIGIVSFVWIDKVEKDATDEAQRKIEAEKQEAATSLPLDKSALDKRLVKVLKSAGIKTIYELAQNHIEDLLSIPRFGHRSITLVELELKKHGYYPGGHRVEDLERETNKQAKRK